jgi:hypothetical protein
MHSDKDIVVLMACENACEQERWMGSESVIWHDNNALMTIQSEAISIFILPPPAARRALRRHVCCVRHSSDSDSSHGSDSGSDGAAAHRHSRSASASTSTAPARRWARANTKDMNPHKVPRGTRRPPFVSVGQGWDLEPELEPEPEPGATRASVEVEV